MQSPDAASITVTLYNGIEPVSINAKGNEGPVSASESTKANSAFYAFSGNVSFSSGTVNIDPIVVFDNEYIINLQLVSSAMFSIGHGLNDSQKVMGIIAAAMIAAHSEGLGMGINSIEDLPDWVAFSCFTAISLGTMSGGWKIVKTMGTRITKVTPLEGVVAETAGAFTLYLTEFLKIPVSTTHTINCLRFCLHHPLFW